MNFLVFLCYTLMPQILKLDLYMMHEVNGVGSSVVYCVYINSLYVMERHRGGLLRCITKQELTALF